MSQRFDQLLARHDALRTRCALQRRHFAATARDIEQRLSGVDRGVTAVRHAMSNPAVIVGGIAIVALIGPKRLLRLAGRVLLMYPSLKGTIEVLRSRRRTREAQRIAEGD